MTRAARIDDCANVPHDDHGCACCPHTCAGPATSGSSTVLINDRPAVRVNDRGLHGACCAGNAWIAIEGAPRVLIGGQLAHRMGDRTQHCGGIGRTVQGSDNVLIGNHCPEETKRRTWVAISLHDDRGAPVPHARFAVTLPDGSIWTGRLDGAGRARRDDVPEGSCQVRFVDFPSQHYWARTDGDGP
jgi:uncharacterized Zn-binding protein involved in type VI secretion